MFIQEASRAIEEKKCLELRYDGFSRVVEVHTVGYDKARKPKMRVWQVRGGSVSNEFSGWKMMDLSDARSAHLTNEPSTAPRPGYKRDDKAFERIVKQVARTPF